MYQVKYPDNGCFNFGIIQDVYDSSEQYLKDLKAQGKRVISDAVFPKSIIVPELECIDIPLVWGGKFDFNTGYHWGCDEYHDYVTLQQVLHDIVDETLTGFLPGRLFSVGVGDGSAHYVITKVMKVNCEIEWRGFCGDRWTDRMFGWGGKFRKKDVNNYLRHSNIFGMPKTVNRKETLTKFIDDFKLRHGYIPKLVSDCLPLE